MKPLLILVIWLTTTGLLTACSEPVASLKSESLHRYSQVRLIAAQLSNDASVSVLLTRDQRISVWDNRKKEQLNSWTEYDLIEPSYLVALSGDNRLLGTAGKQQVTLFDIATGKLTVTWQISGFKSGASITSLSLNHTGSRVLIGLNEGTIIDADLSSDTISMFHLHSGPVTSVHYAAHNEQILSASHDGNVLLWASSSGKIIKEFNRDFRVTSLAFDDSNRRLFYADTVDNNSIIDTSNAQTLSKLDYLERYRYFRQALFVKRGKILITASSKQAITSWDVTSGEELNSWKINAFSAGTTVLSMAEDSTGTLWTLSSDGALEEWLY